MSAAPVVTTPATRASAGSLPSLPRLIASRTVVELKQFFRQRDTVIFIFSFPIMFMALFAAIFGAEEAAPGIPFKQVLLPGMLAAGIINTAFQSVGIGLAVERESGALKQLRGTPLPPLAYFGGVVVRVFIAAVIQTILLLALSVLLFGIDLPADGEHWWRFAWVFVLGTATCTALGIAVSRLPRSVRSASAVVTPIVLVLQFISGVFIQFNALPTWLQNVAEVFPLKWVAQGMRSAFLPDTFTAVEARGTWEHPATVAVLVAWLIVGLIVAAKTFRWQPLGDK